VFLPGTAKFGMEIGPAGTSVGIGVGIGVVVVRSEAKFKVGVWCS